jgi:1-acyl-sn-glycerol-3-phosphate acyltransferase
LRGAWFWTVFALDTAFAFVLLHTLFILLTLGRPERRENLAHWVATLWGRIYFHAMPWWRLTIEGRENLEQMRGPVVIVANHQSMSDILVAFCIGMQFRFLSKDSVFKIPFVGMGMRYAGYIPIERGNRQSHSEALRASARVLQRGISMFFFPEGTRSTTGDVYEFKVGAFKLALENDVEVLPMAFHGTPGLLPKGSGVPGSAHVRVRILPPMRHREGEDAEGYAARVRSVVVEAHRDLCRAAGAPVPDGCAVKV